MVDPTPKSAKPINSPLTALIKPQPKIVPPVEQPDIVKDSEQLSRIEFVNVKDLVKGIEKPKKEDKSKKVDNHEKNQNNQMDEPLDQMDCSNDLPESDQGGQTIADDVNEDDLNHKTNGFSTTDDNASESVSLNGNSSVAVPKPMPRSSISEAGSGEESYSNVNVVNGVPRPVARPRTTAQTNPTGYKVSKIETFAVYYLHIIFCIFFCILKAQIYLYYFLAFIYFLF